MALFKTYLFVFKDQNILLCKVVMHIKKFFHDLVCLPPKILLEGKIKCQQNHLHFRNANFNGSKYILFDTKSRYQVKRLSAPRHHREIHHPEESF